QGYEKEMPSLVERELRLPERLARSQVSLRTVDREFGRAAGPDLSDVQFRFRRLFGWFPTGGSRAYPRIGRTLGTRRTWAPTPLQAERVNAMGGVILDVPVQIGIASGEAFRVNRGPRSRGWVVVPRVMELEPGFRV